MKKIAVLILLTVCWVGVRAQILKPVHWSYAAKKVGDREAIVFFRATIDEGWHLYSQKLKDGGPVKTSFTFIASKDYTLAGPTIEPTPVTHFEKAFNMNVAFFEQSVIFQQKIKLKKAQTLVKGTLEFMVCNDHQCLPPEDISFSVPVK